MDTNQSPDLPLEETDRDLTPGPRRAARRRFVKAGIATAGGLVAATYLKPTLTSLGVPGAAAQTLGSGQGPGGGNPPPAPLTADLVIGSAMLNPNTGQLRVGDEAGNAFLTLTKTTAADVTIVGVDVEVGPVPNPTLVTIPFAVLHSTGGQTPLQPVPPPILPGPIGTTFTFSVFLQIQMPNPPPIVPPDPIRVSVIVQVQMPAPPPIVPPDPIRAFVDVATS